MDTRTEATHPHLCFSTGFGIPGGNSIPASSWDLLGLALSWTATCALHQDLSLDVPSALSLAAIWMLPPACSWEWHLLLPDLLDLWICGFTAFGIILLGLAVSQGISRGTDVGQMWQHSQPEATTPSFSGLL